MARLNGEVIEVYNVGWDEHQPLTLDQVQAWEIMQAVWWRAREARALLDDLCVRVVQGTATVDDLDKAMEGLNR